MSANFEIPSPDAWAQMTDEQRMQALEGAAAATEGVTPPPQAADPAVVPPAPAADPTQGVPAPQPSAEGQPPAVAPQVKTPEQLMKEVENYKRMAHEERQQRQQIAGMLQDPQALQQLLAQQGLSLQPQQPGPELEWENPDAIGHLVNQAVAPLQQTVQQLQAQLAAAQQREELMALRQQFPDIEQSIAEVDQTLPHLAGLPPLAKHFLVQGARAADPAYLQQQIDAKANELAEQKLAASLAAGSAQRPVTLAGVTPAQPNGQEIDLASLAGNPKDWEKLSDDQRRRALGG